MTHNRYGSRNGGLNGNLIHRPAGKVKTRAIKSVSASGDGWVEGYLVSWGSEKDTDLQGEHFSPRTEFCLDWFTERPVLYHHGLDGSAGLRKIGTIKSIEADDLGLWVQAQLDLRDRYASAVYDMIKTSEFGWSSGSVDHLVKIATNGEISVWPIIEGSITPTPAQPSKTSVRPFKATDVRASGNAYSVPQVTMRAFKAIISNDNDAFTRELDGLQARIKSSLDNNLENEFGVESMARQSAKRLARKYADAFNIRATDAELESIASELEQDIDYEVTSAAAGELETEAALAALENEMVTEDNTMARRRALRNRTGYTGRRRAYRNTDDLAMQMENDISAHTDDLAAQMADDLAAQAEDEIAAQMDELRMEKRAKNALINKAWRSAIRQLEATDDTLADADVASLEAGGTGVNDTLGTTSFDNPPIDNMKRRALRRRGYRSDDEALMMDEIKAEEDAILTEEIAAQAYRNGFSKGVRRAFRTTDTQEDADLSITEKRRARRRAWRSEDDATASDDEAVARRSRRRRAWRSDDEATASEDETTARRSRRRRAWRSEDDATASDDEAVARRRRGYRSDDEATATDDVTASRAFRRGYRAALSRARRNADESTMSSPYASDDAYAMDDEPMMSEETMARRSRRRAKSAGAGYWQKRVAELESLEAPGQRSFGRIKSVRDVADREGAYANAFKSYLYKGDRWMTETERYVLTGKGQVSWGKSASFQRGNDGSYKTYFGGSDASAGFAVPPDWVNELNKNIQVQTVMAPECRTRTTTSDRIVQPSIITTDGRRAHAAQVRWPGEVISSNAVHRTVEDSYHQVDVPIHVMLMSLTAGNSALEDITFNLEDEINEAFSEAVAVAYDELIWGGDGQGKIEGIVTNPEVTTSASTGMQSVSGYIPTGSASGIPTADVLKKMLFHLPRQFRQRAKWYMNSNTGLQIATLKDGEGNYLIDQRAAALSDSGGVPDTLLGRPIVYNEFADDISENAFPIVLGDLSRGYLIGKRVDFAIRRFDDSQYAELDQVLYLGRARIGGQVLLPSAMKVLKVAAS